MDPLFIKTQLVPVCTCIDNFKILFNILLHSAMISPITTNQNKVKYIIRHKEN